MEIANSFRPFRFLLVTFCVTSTFGQEPQTFQRRLNPALPATSNQTAEAIPSLMHFCAVHCTTLIWANDHFTTQANPGGSIWTVESFTREAVFIRRTDTRPRPYSAVYQARISDEGDRIDGDNFKFTWGAALNSIPGSGDPNSPIAKRTEAAVEKKAEPRGAIAPKAPEPVFSGPIDEFLAKPPVALPPGASLEEKIRIMNAANPRKPLYESLRNQYGAARAETIGRLGNAVEALLKAGSDSAARGRFDETLTAILREHDAKIKGILGSSDPNGPNLNDLSVTMFELKDAPSLVDGVRTGLQGKGYSVNNVEEALKVVKAKFSPSLTRRADAPAPPPTQAKPTPDYNDTHRRLEVVFNPPMNDLSKLPPDQREMVKARDIQRKNLGLKIRNDHNTAGTTLVRNVERAVLAYIASGSGMPSKAKLTEDVKDAEVAYRRNLIKTLGLAGIDNPSAIDYERVGLLDALPVIESDLKNQGVADGPLKDGMAVIKPLMTPIALNQAGKGTEVMLERKK